LSFTSRTT